MWRTYGKRGIHNDDLFYKARNVKHVTYGLRSLRKSKKITKPQPAKPKRVPATGTRLIRDTDLVRRIKAIHKDVCQICGKAFELLGDETYSEGNHLHPLGQPHNGDDMEQNILIVCPNHHVLCDYGAIQLDWEALHKKSRHKLQKKYVDFHNENIYGNEVKAKTFEDCCRAVKLGSHIEYSICDPSDLSEKF
jgi:hypothetical protein